MSENVCTSHEKLFLIEIAKQGRALCKKCRQKCSQGDLRIAKMVPNPEGMGRMKNWYHVNCIFEAFLKQRPTTKRIESSEDLEGFDSLSTTNKSAIEKKISSCNGVFKQKLEKATKKNRNAMNKGNVFLQLGKNISDDSLSVSSDSSEGLHKDNYFRKFRTLVVNVSKVNDSSEKTNIIRDAFIKGIDGTGFKGDIVLWCKLLLPAVIKRVFHLQTTQLIKLFSRVFDINEKTILNYVEDQNDIGLAIQHFFEKSKKYKPARKSTLTLHEVDEFLETLTNLQKKDDQFQHFKSFIEKCTGNDLKVIIRLIKHDLRMNAGTKHVLEALHPNAYILFQSCRDIRTVINSCWPTPIINPPFDHHFKTVERGVKRKLTQETEPTKKGQKIESIECEAPERRKSIPNYFEIVKLYLEDGVKDIYGEWIRYFIAYGGTILQSDEIEHATHILHLNDTIAEPKICCSNTARHVIIEWIKDTVEKDSLQDWRAYTVRWNPSA